MRVYRVFPFLPSAPSGSAGSPDYVPEPRGSNRLDNPDHYAVRYFAETPAAAIAETMGQLDVWHPAMFSGRPGSGMHRSLGVYDVKNVDRLLDLDDGRVLAERGLRPTQVVRRNLQATQAWALKIYDERATPRGARRWDGVRWWSWYRPEWPVLGMWAGSVEVLDVERLDLRHPAVVEAAQLLGRVV